MTEDDGIADPTVVFFEGMTEDDGMVDGITDVVGLTDDDGMVDGLVVGVFFVGLVPVRLLSFVGMTEDDGMIDGIADGMNDGVNVPSTINNLSVLDPKLPSTYTTGSTASPTLIPI